MRRWWMVSALIDTQLLRLDLQLHERTTVACPVKPQLNRAGANEHFLFEGVFGTPLHNALP